MLKKRISVRKLKKEYANLFSEWIEADLNRDKENEPILFSRFREVEKELMAHGEDEDELKTIREKVRKETIRKIAKANTNRFIMHSR